MANDLGQYGHMALDMQAHRRTEPHRALPPTAQLDAALSADRADSEQLRRQKRIARDVQLLKTVMVVIAAVLTVYTLGLAAGVAFFAVTSQPAPAACAAAVYIRKC